MKLIRFEGPNMYKVESGSNNYYITLSQCPGACGTTLIMCNCPDFTIGRHRKNVNPFKKPCKHVAFFLKEVSSESRRDGTSG